jgi:pilus assembly protein Flp/PilA
MVLRRIDDALWLAIQAVERLRWRLSEDEGQAMVEYAIVAALIAVAAMAAVQALGGGITTAFHNIANAVSGSGSGGGGGAP